MVRALAGTMVRVGYSIAFVCYFGDSAACATGSVRRSTLDGCARRARSAEEEIAHRFDRSVHPTLTGMCAQSMKRRCAARSAVWPLRKLIDVKIHSDSHSSKEVCCSVRRAFCRFFRGIAHHCDDGPIALTHATTRVAVGQLCHSDDLRATTAQRRVLSALWLQRWGRASAAAEDACC